MPRPRRDYGAAIRESLVQIEQNILKLGVERAKFLKMLKTYEDETVTPGSIDAILTDVVEHPTVPPKPGTRSSKGKRAKG